MLNAFWAHNKTTYFFFAQFEFHLIVKDLLEYENLHVLTFDLYI